MSDKLKKAVAIIALVLIGIFTVSFILYLINKDMLGGAVGDLATWSGGFGLLFTLVLYISRSFPSQQVKDEERERLYKEAQQAEQEALKEQEEAKTEGEQSDDLVEGECENNSEEDSLVAE